DALVQRSVRAVGQRRVQEPRRHQEPDRPSRRRPNHLIRRGEETIRSSTPIPATIHGRYERFAGATTATLGGAPTTKDPSVWTLAVACCATGASEVGCRTQLCPSADARIVWCTTVSPAVTDAGYTSARSAFFASGAARPLGWYAAVIRYALPCGVS